MMSPNSCTFWQVIGRTDDMQQLGVCFCVYPLVPLLIESPDFRTDVVAVSHDVKGKKTFLTSNIRI